MKQLTKFNSWKKLYDLKNKTRIDFANASNEILNYHIDNYTRQIGPVFYDFSRQMLNPVILDTLVDLAVEANLQKKIENMINGEKVNTTENRAALHSALREFGNQSIFVDGIDIMKPILATREKIELISELIRSKKWVGYSGKPIKDIVNIGIGGSDLGPRFCINALGQYVSSEFKYHFISDADPDSFKKIANCIDPQTTLFIVSSKSFTTPETLLNARKALSLYDGLKDRNSDLLDRHFIAVTTQPEKALKLGIKHILPIWEWVGGRFSLCSAINLITAIAIGYEQFQQLLLGANKVDKHFLQTDFKDNIPVLMALIGIWNINFLNIQNLIILLYAKQLEFFSPYIQQLEMESNGKTIDINGDIVDYSTGPIVWGGLGNQAQHSYLQLLCQGTHRCTGDIISLKKYEDELINSMCEYKMNVLSKGLNTGTPGAYKGNRIMPLNHISILDLTPFSLGTLVSLYEHKVYTQAVIWNINPFDQPGIELAKLLHLDAPITA
ncbi:glucose-6-phosphate isomerase [Legionella waltersii]|uniref:Glucose-6-phosphate isomerase n=1 Tax=Legionella waltersii TaxID=66969 RepID=A0A0W1AN53_9GAMM|nr:glucose-6-phosphate isomerase [Legionella waltersii]KTD82751.1 glucose-6-phosphate isomerase [Legionella waltersii]SNV01095.1 glucose-6-phosphate isomerase [Legionella waltersii]